MKQYGDWIQLSDMLQMTAIDNNVVQATKLPFQPGGAHPGHGDPGSAGGGHQRDLRPKVVDGAETEVLSRSTLTPSAC